MTSLNRPGAAMIRAFVATVVAVGWTLPAKAQQLFSEDAYTSYTPDLANGSTMAAAAGCASCHASGNNPQLLAGGMKLETTLGEVSTPNITAERTSSWTNAQYLNAVMRGLAPDGRSYVAVFPYSFYAGMKPEDVLDIRGYIASLPSSDNTPPETALSFPYNQSRYWSLWKRSNLDTRPYSPGDGSPQDRGRYLVEAVGACGACHTPRSFLWGLEQERALTGEKSLNGTAAPDISQARIGAIADTRQFTHAMIDEGKLLSGSPITDPVKQRMVEGWRKLSDEDRAAVLSYLSSKEVKVERVAEAPRASCKATVAGAVAPVAGGGGELETAADQFLGKYCRGCHGVGERDESVFPVGDLASVANNPASIVRGQRNQSRLYQSVSVGRMPKSGGRPTAAELETLGRWIDSLAQQPAVQQAAAPSAPLRGRDIIPLREVLPAVLRDISDLLPEDRRFARYFSYREQFNSVFSCETEADFRQRLQYFSAGFNKMLNSVSNGRTLIVPATVEGTSGLIVRVDTRDLDWTEAAWAKLFSEYQYGIDPKSDPQLKELADQSQTDIPILRTDWFVSYAGRPSLYYDLLSLPDTINEIEKNIGVDVGRNIRELRVVRGGFEEGASGVSGHNRMVERHDLPQGGYYWKSYDFAQSIGVQDLRRRPHGPKEVPLPAGLPSFNHDGGEMIFTLPNGMQGYYLSTADGKRIDVGPAEIVTNRARPANRGFLITNAKSCFDCHADGIIAKSDQMRDFIKASPTFTPEQQDILLRMYVEQAELDRHYETDRQKFVSALERIGAAQQAAGGQMKSLSGPEGAEIITWNADLYDGPLDQATLAAEFDLSVEEFEDRIMRLSDSYALRVGLDWLTQLRAGGSIARQEFELSYPQLVSTLTGFESNRSSPQRPAQDEPTQQQVAVAPKAALDAGDQVKLAIKVDKTDVFVGDKLNFTVSADQTCELQVFYVETDGDVVELEERHLGPQPLPAGTERVIPAAGGATFSPAGHNETLVVFCRPPSSTEKPLDKTTAKELVDQSISRTRDYARGLVLDEIASKPGFQLLTFNVRDK